MNAQAVEMTKEVREWINRQEARPFAEVHHIIVDLPDGGVPLRFASLRCAARTAAHLRIGMYDEESGVAYSHADAVRISEVGW